MTITQGCIFDQPVARATDPNTSWQAARRAATKAESNRAYALRVLRNHGEDGCTDFELSAITGVQATSIGVRRKELCRAGLVVDSGRRRPSPSGSLAIVWKAVS